MRDQLMEATLWPRRLGVISHASALDLWEFVPKDERTVLREACEEIFALRGKHPHSAAERRVEAPAGRFVGPAFER